MKSFYPFRGGVLLLALLWTTVSFGQSRSGAFNLTNTEDDVVHLVYDKDHIEGAGQPFTFEGWFKIQSADNYGNDFTFFRAQGGVGSQPIALVWDGTRFRLDGRGKTWYFKTPSVPNMMDTWRHIAFRYDGAFTAAIFVDGVLLDEIQLLFDNGYKIDFLLEDKNTPEWTQIKVGGLAVADGIKGKAYVAECRLWKAALYTVYISQYWDEEVNSTHPYWNQLLTYHHMTRSYLKNFGTGMWYHSDDVKGYDEALTFHNNVYVVEDQYPPIKPPRFYGMTEIGSTECASSDQISVYWNSLRNHNYRKGYDVNGNSIYPNYELIRDDNSSVPVYSSSSNNYTDNNVSEGNSYKYELRTYWLINGTKYYSDFYDLAKYGSVAERYDAPALTVSTDQCDLNINLSWSLAETPPQWTIKRSLYSNMSDAVTIATVNGSTTTFEDNTVSIETDYYYTVTASGMWEPCIVVGTASAVKRGYTSQAAAAPTNFTITPDIAGRAIDLSWTNLNNNNHDNIVIKRTKFGTSDEKIIELAASATSYSDTDVEICTSYTYAVASKNECDVTYALEELTGNVSEDLSNVMSTLEVSKGYYGDRVRLEWTINGGLAQIDRFKVLRSLADQSNFKLLDIVDNNLIYDDKTAVGGVFYKYMVVGESACNTEVIQTNSLTELGFTLPFGVANGHIEYAGGNAVEGVKVRFESETGAKGKSLKFDGNNDYVDIEKLTYYGTYDEVTTEAWVKTSATRKQTIISYDPNEYWNLGMNTDGTVSWSVFSGFFSSDLSGNTVINDGLWHHVAAVFDQGQMSVYVDGELDATSTAASPTFGRGIAIRGYMGAAAGSVLSGGFDDPFFYNGNLDEVRIWSVAKTADEIAENYSRLLYSAETGLSAYWRMDEGVGQSIYDASNTAVEFNKNDGQFIGDVAFSIDIPSSDQLGIMGITNAYGNYSINYVPYIGVGEIFTVTPSLGQHEFEPNSRSVYVGDGATTQNNLDFKDISFFTVQGKVTYQNSNVPVEGVNILIDGENALGADNKPVRTDENGDYTINVPIGKHYLTAEKDGHYFAEGQFPPLDEGQITYHEFIEDLTVHFVDSTKITVAGRIVGGNVEGEKVLGFGKSVNNIGVADLELQLQKEGYDLDENDPDVADIVSLTTDPETGEFTLELIPEQFVVNKAGNDSYLLNPGDLSVVDLRNSLTYTVERDTTKQMIGGVLTQVVDTFAYHHPLVYTIKTTPDIFLTSDKQGAAFDGEDEIITVNQSTGIEDTITVAGLGLNYPVMQMGKTYDAYIRVVETYSNPSHPTLGNYADHVPVKGANISITNELMVNSLGVSGQTDADGYLLHSFKAGQPNTSMNGDLTFTKKLEINAEVEGLNIAYQGGLPFRAYVLGARAIDGSDFITYGPQIPEIILRDPPGTNSYAYIEKGSIHTRKEKWKYAINAEQSLDLDLFNGTRIGFGGGLAGPLIETQYKNNSQYGMSLIKDFDHEGNYVKSYEFTRRIETSSDPEDVGSDADLYIGTGMNYFFTKSQNLRLLERQFCVDNGIEFYEHDATSSSQYVLGIMDGYMMDGESETFFVYSHKYIINELIPELINLRDAQFQKSHYVSEWPTYSQYHGLNNDDSSLPEGTLSYTFTPQELGEIDSVEMLNQQIGIWLGYIQTNEMEKYKAEVVENISIDGSSGQYMNEITEEYSAEYRSMNAGTFKIYTNATAGFVTGGNGFELNSYSEASLNLGVGSEEQTANKLTFGYVIDENDEGDYYSIDVKKTQGVTYASPDEFTSDLLNRDQWVKDQVELGLVSGGSAGGAIVGSQVLVSKFVGKMTTKLAARNNAYINAGLFSLYTGYHMYQMTTYAINRAEIHGKMDDVNVEGFTVSGFGISSPVFSIRGGQSRCPYEPGETSLFYIDESTTELVDLHTATLQREIPVITAEQSEIANVPESENAEFTLYLQNESESQTDMWYTLSLLDATNPDGAVLRVDGNEMGRSYLVPAGKTLTKSLTIAKGKAEVLEYDSIGVVLHSQCQYNPADLTEDIGDTVFLSVKFLPECSDVTLGGLNENWVANYDDKNEVPITLSGYNLNLATLERIDFQYKSLSGSPITVKTFFKEDNAAYQAYSGEKELLNDRSEVNLIWDLSALTDRQYQVRARAHCIDGSVTETDYLIGTIDRVTPKPFGTPQPTDGILSAGENISIKFNETIEAGLVKDHNISVKGVLNGADIAHGTSQQLNGANEYTAIQGVSFNNKSFTIEFWMQREFNTTGTIFSKGLGDESMAMRMSSGGQLELQLGTEIFSVDPTGFYSAVYPEDSWHHWAFVYDKDLQRLQLFLDDVEVISIPDQEFNTADIEALVFGQDANGGNNLAMNLHEVRIWEEARMLGDIVANMNNTLNGRELALYGYWPMDEGTGDLARDYAAGRNMNLYGNWLLRPEGHSFSFDGSQYLTIDGQNVIIGQQTDMTIEFWFKGNNPTGTVTLFSQGTGEASVNEEDPTLSMSINADASGQIYVLSNEYRFTATTEDFFDNTWHHFALTLDRRSNVKSYIDGSLQKQTVATNFAGMAGATMWIGARGVRQNTVVNVDQQFTGEMDEVRIWNTQRKAEHIKLYMNHKLSGEEDGLVAYYPFEAYATVMGATLLDSSLEDQINSDIWNNDLIATAANGESYSSNIPKIKDIRPAQDIPFTFVVNDDELLITPTIDPTRIEGQVLEITVSDIQDLYGNRMQSPASWTTYMEQNQVVWQENNVTLEAFTGEEISFTVNVVNMGGIPYEFNLDNLPSWLTASQEFGTVQPNSTLPVTFTAVSGLNVGSYAQGINLSTALGFDEKLTVNLRVKAQEPNWNVNPEDYQLSMNVFGKLIIEGVPSSDELDMVGAFVNGECRGKAYIEYYADIDAYLVVLNVLSNTLSGENIELKAWDASKGRIYENVTPELVFDANQLHGTALDPVLIETDNTIRQEISLPAGWSWISVNLEAEALASVNSFLQDIGAEGDILKDQSSFDQYSESTGWIGSLTTNGGVKPESMYKIKLTNPSTIVLKGSPVDTRSTSINITAGWNYIGYLPQENMPVNEAMARMNPQVNDLVKNASSFAIYSGPSYGWIGTLRSMKPGEGYMLNSGATTTLVYPKRSTTSGSRMTETLQAVELPEEFITDYSAFSNTMSLIARIEGYTPDAGEVLIAFAGEEPRGFVQPVKLASGEALYLLNISGDLPKEVISFRLFDSQTGRISYIEELINFENNGIEGTFETPLSLSLQEDNTSFEDLLAYPNPTEGTLKVVFKSKAEAEYEIQLVNVAGRNLMKQTVKANAQGGVVSQLDLSRLERGVYILILVGQEQKYEKLIIRQ